MKTVSTCFAAVLLAAVAASAHADPTPEQRTEVENCKIMSGAVFQFAKARDRKQSKMDAFKDVTHGQTYVPGSLLDETLQWAYAHPDEQPDTASGHFYGRCVMDAYDARNPDTEGELDIAALGCQQSHPGLPAEIRDCIEDKAQDIITRSQTQAAVATSGSPSGAPAAATVAAIQTPSSANLVAVAPPPPAQVPTAPQPAPVPAATPSAPVAKSAVETPAPIVPPQMVAATPSLPAATSQPVAAALPSPAPHEVPRVLPMTSNPGPVVAAAPVAPPVAPALAQTQTAPPTPVAVPAPAPIPVVAAASAPAPVVPPLPVPVAPVPAKTASAAPVVAAAATPPPAAPAASLPPLPSVAAATAGPPPNLPGFGKLSVGMPMDEAYKAMGSHGDTDWDQQGEVHTYMIGDDHGFIEIRPSSAGTLRSIRVVGGADAHVAPILNVVLGDGAFVLINNVGMPSSRTPLPGDKELWSYGDRNYAFEISPGGDVIGVRIVDPTDVVPQ